MKIIQTAVACVALLVVVVGHANASVLVEFDVTNAISASSSPIAATNVASGVATSALWPVNVSGGGIATPGLYWSSWWTTAPSPNFSGQRLFFNILADSDNIVSFDTLDFSVFSGGADQMGVDLRVFGTGGSTLFSPLLHLQEMHNSPSNFAASVSADISSLPSLVGGEAYQFSLSFYSRDPSKRIGLTGDRSDIGAFGQNVVLSGEVTEAVPEPSSILMFTGLALCFGIARRRKRQHMAR